MVVITPKMNLLQIPIMDKYYVPPSDPAALARGTSFAAAKGLLSPRCTKEAINHSLINGMVTHCCGR